MKILFINKKLLINIINIYILSLKTKENITAILIDFRKRLMHVLKLERVCHYYFDRPL